MLFLERRLFFMTAGREKQFIYSKKNKTKQDDSFFPHLDQDWSVLFIVSSHHHTV